MTSHFGTAAARHNLGLSFNVGSADAVWGLQESTALRVHRFSCFSSSLSRNWQTVSPGARVLLCAIAFEAILTEQDLLAFAAASSARLYLIAGSRITWESVANGTNGSTSRAESRSVCARTELAMQLSGTAVDWIGALRETTIYLTKHYPKTGGLPSQDILRQVLLDGSAWLYLHLPGCLFSHLTGALSMPVLANAVLQRQTQIDRQSTPDDDLSPTDAAIDLVSEDALDRLFEAPSNERPVTPEKTIAHLKSICSVTENDAGIRLATHLNRANVRDKIALVANVLDEEGWVAAALVSWTTHLLDHGSVRKVNPAVSTISAYLSDLLSPLADALVRLNKPPSMMLQNDWEALFEHLNAHVGNVRSGAALSSLHLWAVRTFGCDPLAWVVFARDSATRVHANLIWPAELAQALAMAAEISRDERVCNQCMVLIALGASGLFRVGELPSLTTHSIRETRDGLRVEIDPGRGSHGGKSRAARRVVLVHDFEAKRLIRNWCIRRNEESTVESPEHVLIFGDPHHPNKLYRFGHCSRMVNDILKSCTGDSSVSFHSLRHSSATARCLRLLTEPTEPAAIDPLDVLCHQMGHAHPSTLWNTYFHLPEVAIRIAIDRTDELCKLDTPEAAFWLDKKEESLRQQKCRDTRQSSGCLYHKLLNNKAWGKHPADCNLNFSTNLQDVPEPQAGLSQAVNLQWVRQALAVLQSVTDVGKTQRLLGAPADEIKRLCHGVQTTIRALRGSGRTPQPPLLIDTASVDHHVSWAHEQLQDHSHWSFQVPPSSMAQRLATHLYSHGSASASGRAAQAWISMHCHGVLSLHDPLACQFILALLKAADYAPQAMVARVQGLADDRSDADHKWHLLQATRAIDAIVLETLGTRIRVEVVRPRRGFPSRYLLLGRHGFSPARAAPSAALRMREVHGLFFALNVFHQMSLMQGGLQ